MNNLMVVDSKHLFRKELIGNFVGIDDILVVDDITKAKELLSRENNGEVPYSVLVINTVFLEKEVKEKELEEISLFFQGYIIVRVDTEESGIELIKKGYATDYYIANQNQDNNLKRAITNAEVHRRCLSRLVDMNRKLDTLKILKKVLNNDGNNNRRD